MESKDETMVTPVESPPSSSPLTRSLDLSSSTIDELTNALSNVASSQEPESAVVCCCCGKEDCQNTVAWLEVKSHLEKRLILSAEVGQALLQKHEAYVRQLEKTQQQQHQRTRSKQTWNGGRNDNEDGQELSSEERLSREYDEVLKGKAELEKRLNVALVNNEVTEVSNKTLLQELQEARETISRLTAHNARSMGWDARLTAALRERDDMQQERDSESHRARLAESRFAALKDKSAKLQSEVRRLQEALEEKRQHRLESSETILTEARSRLESVRKNTLGTSARAEQEELTRVLESLVNDNETLQRDNGELQRLLSETREDVHTLQQDLEEHRANVYPYPRSGPSTPLTRHFNSGSVTSLFSPNRRNLASEAPGRNTEPLTPDSTRRPLSPLDALVPPESRLNAFTYPLNRRPSSSSTPISYDIEEDANDETVSESERPKGGHRPLMLLTRSRAVQTDPISNLSTFAPHMSHLSTPPDPRSESSSFSEASHVSGVFERATSLFNKMTQADALTLTNRLKRQHLKGADLSHLSRTTVSNIVAEAIELRAQYRFLLEDEKIVVTCTRKDLRVLFKLLKDMFMELGQLRVSLNDVIFDPSCAARVSEFALNPSKAAEAAQKESGASGISGPSWIAPLSRLFSGTQKRERSPSSKPSGSGSLVPTSRTTRLAPKLGPALAASTTTVNVEFSGSGVGRATTTEVVPPQPVVTPALPISETPSLAPSSSSAVMNIFAGAPKPQEDPWVVLPRATPRRVKSTYLRSDIAAATATLGRSSASNFKKLNRLSKNVDAVIDSEQTVNVNPVLLAQQEDDAEDDDGVAPLPQYRTLRRRGLSDSSIHSTFTNHGEEGLPSSPSSPTKRSAADPSIIETGLGSSGVFPGGIQWPDGTSVFQALTRTVQSLRLATSNSAPVVQDADLPVASGSGNGSSAAAELLAATRAQAQAAPATADTLVPPSASSASSSSFASAPSTNPNSPIVQRPSPITAESQPLAEEPTSAGVLSPFATPKSAAKRRAKTGDSSLTSTPTRSGRGSDHGAGLVGAFLPSLAISNWIPAGTNDVLDQVSGGDPFVDTTSQPSGSHVGSGRYGGRRSMGGPGSAGRVLRDFM